MRRALVLSLIGLLSIPPIPARGQAVGAGAGAIEEASASWLVRGPRGPRFRYVQAWRYRNPIGATTTMVIAGTAGCKLTPVRRGFDARCKDRARIRFIRHRDFEFDPLLRNARVVFEENGVRNVVAWTGRDRAGSPGWGIGGGQRSTTVHASHTKRADLRGRIFGLRLDGSLRRLYAAVSRGWRAILVHETGTRFAPVRRWVTVSRTFRFR